MQYSFDSASDYFHLFMTRTNTMLSTIRMNFLPYVDYFNKAYHKCVLGHYTVTSTINLTPHFHGAAGANL